MSELKVNTITSKDGKKGPVFAGITTVNSTGCMVMPGGPTEYRGGRGRGVFGGGYGSAPYPEVNMMDYVQIASTGSGFDFGDLTYSGSVSGGTSSSTRGLFWGGRVLSRRVFSKD